MSKFLTDQDDEALLRANEANLYALFESLQGISRIDVESNELCLRTVSDVRFPFFNSVLRARLPESNAEEALREVLGLYFERELPMMWWVTPSDTPSDLGARLEQQGLAKMGTSPAMAIDLKQLEASRPGSTSVEVERMTRLEQLDGWVAAFAAGFGFPPFAAEVYHQGISEMGYGPGTPAEHYVGLLEGKPVASSTLFRAAGVAGVYNVASLPEARGRGAGTAVSAAPLYTARDEGFHVAILQASQLGYPIYRKLGFRDLGQVETYVWLPPKQT